jgi:hypothetical protein
VGDMSWMNYGLFGLLCATVLPSMVFVFKWLPIWHKDRTDFERYKFDKSLEQSDTERRSRHEIANLYASAIASLEKTVDEFRVALQAEMASLRGSVEHMCRYQSEHTIVR